MQFCRLGVAHEQLLVFIGALNGLKNWDNLVSSIIGETFGYSGLAFFFQYILCNSVLRTGPHYHINTCFSVTNAPWLMNLRLHRNCPLLWFRHFMTAPISFTFGGYVLAKVLVI